MNRKIRNRKKAQVLRELEKNPLVERACRNTDIARSTFYRWCKSDKEFEQHAEEAQEKGRGKLNDFVESKLLESISEGHFPAMRFWLEYNHAAYRKQRASEMLQLLSLLEEYRQAFELAYTKLGPDKGDELFKHASQQEIEKKAETNAWMKNFNRVTRKV